MEPALQTVDLRVNYGNGRRARTAVNGLNLTVNRGEVVGFLGPNGAGKSSTIKALMGFVTPTAGEARLLGKPAGSLDARQRVGFLPEVAMYYPWLTPRETLWMYGRLQGLDARQIRTQTEELLARVGMAERSKERLKGFSKGMLQRVGVAQALLGAPELLVLDEVSSGLDPLGRRELRELLLEYKQRGVTIFFSSHELSEVTSLCDRIIMLNRGQVVAERPVLELLAELRRFWVRFRPRASAPEPVPPVVSLGDGVWEAGAATLPDWRGLMERLTATGAEILDAGERDDVLEEYFVRMVGGNVQ